MTGDTYKDMLQKIHQSGVTKGYFVGVVTTLLVLSTSLIGVPLWVGVGVTMVFGTVALLGTPLDDVDALIDRLDDGDVFVQNVDESVVSLAEAREQYANNEITMAEYEVIAEQVLAAESEDVTLSMGDEERQSERRGFRTERQGNT